MNYPSIRIEGSILTGDILETVAMGDRQDGQRAQDFGFPTGTAVKDEIAAAWASARAFWTAYQSRIERLREGASGVTETRNLWITPLLGMLGYTLELAGKGEVVNQKNYAISHRDHARDAFPVHIMGWQDSLDKKREDSGPRMSPHALVQEYVNLTEHLYAIVTNGRQLRLLRDSSRLIKLSFLEFDLERIFTEELFADFALLFRLLHATRMPVKQSAAAESIIERYHQESLDSGSRIRDGLSKAVENCIKELANGFLAHEANELLRDSARRPDAARDLYQNLLRLIYRMLFLMVIEERGLVYPFGSDKRLKAIYERYYSIGRLRKLAEKRHFAEGKYHDAWDALRATFRLYADPKVGEKIGIASLGGMYHQDAIGNLAECRLSNAVLLTAIRRLSYFQHPDTKQYLRVNYGALNVEEFGSVYEGLLEYDAVLIEPDFGQFEFHLVAGEARSASGSHYTPDELVQPLLKHSIDYLIAEKLKEPDPQAALLSLRVADIACGSGHILLAAARRIGTELAILRTGEDQPSPTAMREAIRDVIRHCIYGVDLNPLAVELCKVALWLEAHVPGQPLNFLDHHIKCGNAIVGFVRQEELEKGVPDEAFKTLPEDDKDLAAEFRRKNRRERGDKLQTKLSLAPELQQQLDDIHKRWNALSGLPERSPVEIEQKKKRFLDFSASPDAWLLEQIACIPIAQFYTPKTPEHKVHLITDEEYREFLSGRRTPQGQATAHAWALAHRKKFFHWFLQFPEIIQRGGFDCILGNPPFLGNRKISGKYGDEFKEYIAWEYAPAGVVELVTYFFRRAFTMLKSDGYAGLIATNTISQGFSREGGLAHIESLGGEIVFTNPSLKWPGNAVLEVALVAFKKGHFNGQRFIRIQPVSGINSYLKDTSIVSGEPYTLAENQSKAFIGSVIAGSGFILEPSEARLLMSDAKNIPHIKPYLTGQDLFSSPGTSASRYIIDLGILSLDQAKRLDSLITIIRERVKPNRDTLRRESYRRRWWQFAERCESLYSETREFDRVLVTARISKTHAFAFVSNDQVFADALVVFAFEGWAHFTVLQSSIHEMWAWAYCTTMKTDKNYSPTRVFQTFPFPKIGSSSADLSPIGKEYYGQRLRLQEAISCGLTSTYNLFHSPDLSPELVGKVSKKSADEAEIGYRAILKLRELHRELDQAVLAAYVWTDLDLEHNFYDLDYLPENDRTRYTISPAARKEVLQRLLKLNHQRYAEEQAAAASVKPKTKVTNKTARTRKQPEPVPADDWFSREQKVARAVSISVPRDRGLSDEVWWTRFIYGFINEAGVEATLPRLDAAWQLMVQKGLHSADFQEKLGKGYSRWNNSFPTKMPNQGFFQHVVDLQSNGLISATRGSWQLRIGDETRMRVFSDKTGWTEVDVAAALLILDNHSDLLQSSSSETGNNLVTYFQQHAMTA